MKSMWIQTEMSKQLKKLIALGLMGAICTVSVFSVGIFSRKVYVNVDGAAISALMVNTDTDSVLKQLGIDISEYDLVDRTESSDGCVSINIKRASDITLVTGDEKVKLKFFGGKVSDALAAANISFEEGNYINLPLSSDLVPGMEIDISKKAKVTITADGETKEYFVPFGKISDVLQNAGITLSCEDMINADISAEVSDDMKLEINRVTCREVSKTERTPFSTITKKTTLLKKGAKNISTQGKEGQEEVVYKETLVDGEVVKSEDISHNVIKKPVDEIILVGTGGTGKSEVVPKSVSVASPETQKVKSSASACVVSGFATAYTAPPGAHTSTGRTPRQGYTAAVNPSLIPYNKKIMVKFADGTSETLVAEDTGGALKKGKAVVDIYMNSKEACMKFGRKKVDVFII